MFLYIDESSIFSYISEYLLKMDVNSYKMPLNHTEMIIRFFSFGMSNDDLWGFFS